MNIKTDVNLGENKRHQQMAFRGSFWQRKCETLTG